MGNCYVLHLSMRAHTYFFHILIFVFSVCYIGDQIWLNSLQSQLQSGPFFLLRFVETRSWSGDYIIPKWRRTVDLPPNDCICIWQRRDTRWRCSVEGEIEFDSWLFVLPIQMWLVRFPSSHNGQVPTVPEGNFQCWATQQLPAPKLCLWAMHGNYQRRQRVICNYTWVGLSTDLRFRTPGWLSAPVGNCWYNNGFESNVFAA